MTQYLSGFGNEFCSEAEKGAVPREQNSPQKAPHSLIAEQLSGSAFTAKRKENLRSWLYKIRPSVGHGAFQPCQEASHWLTLGQELPPSPPTQLRWSPLPSSREPQNFITGLHTICLGGDPLLRRGSAVHIYQCDKPMDGVYFYNSDGDFLIVPQKGALDLHTEFGLLKVEPTEIAVVPRGIKFQANPQEKHAYGYVCELFGGHFELPHLGPIGSNGLAAPRDFLCPVASFENKKGTFKLLTRFAGHIWQANLDASPLDVVGWHGNYYPYKYDLKRFNTINTVSFDHPDPSIFTVLTAPSEKEGTAQVDFVIFPPRWMVAEKTFRPPYYHRNIMSEYMGLIHGVYDAKLTSGKEDGFLPGGGSLHNCMSSHGPDREAFHQASDVALQPKYLADTLAFMFESCFIYRPTPFSLTTPALQARYFECWKGIGGQFKPA